MVNFAEVDPRKDTRRGRILVFAAFSSVIVVTTVSLLLRPFFASPTSLALSHIEAHVPSEREFDAFLTRDLEHYFTTKEKKNVTVTYELLRDMPTQTGIAYPKFYAWVIVR